MTKAFVLSETSKARMQGIDSRLIQIVERAIIITKVDFGIPEFGGLRTEEEQSKLFASGRSKADGVHRLSKHQTGKAVDFFAFVDGKATWEKEPMLMVATAFFQAASDLKIPIQWGGLWKSFSDFPHIQLN